jgi:alpha-aminoadipate/glutamate carrier protein LysW
VKNKVMRGVIMSECPVCGEKVEQMKEVEKNEIIACSSCENELEVISVTPFKLQKAPEEQEDWGE